MRLFPKDSSNILFRIGSESRINVGSLDVVEDVDVGKLFDLLWNF